MPTTTPAPGSTPDSRCTCRPPAWTRPLSTATRRSSRLPSVRSPSCRSGSPRPPGGAGPPSPPPPPLLAVAFRPLALLPFGVAAAVWMVLIAGLVAATVLRIDLRRPVSLFVVCVLALPTCWAIVIGQAQVAVTLLLAVGMPWSVALATNLKLFPILVAVWWVGRRDWRSLARLAVWLVALAAIQLVLEPAGTLAYPGFLRLDQVGSVISLSPFAVSPWLWAALLVAGTAFAVWAAPRRHGWAAAVALATLASPRLLLYQLSSLVAGVRDPADR